MCCLPRIELKNWSGRLQLLAGCSSRGKALELAVRDWRRRAVCARDVGRRGHERELVAAGYSGVRRVVAPPPTRAASGLRRLLFAVVLLAVRCSMALALRTMLSRAQCLRNLLCAIAAQSNEPCDLNARRTDDSALSPTVDDARRERGCQSGALAASRTATRTRCTFNYRTQRDARMQRCEDGDRLPRLFLPLGLAPFGASASTRGRR